MMVPYFLESWLVCGKSSPNGRTIQVTELLQFTQYGFRWDNLIHMPSVGFAWCPHGFIVVTWKFSTSVETHEISIDSHELQLKSS